MDYKGYKLNLSGVYKVENNKKLYSLEIFKDTAPIFKSDWIYENEKRAFKDAKEMINKQRFDTEIIRKNTKKEELKNDYVYQSIKIKKISNNIIVTLILLLAVSYILSLFGIKEIPSDLSVFVYIYSFIGILFVICILYWGIKAKDNLELNNKQKKFYSILWWINLLYNNGPILAYREQPFKNTKKGWHSVFILMLMIVQLIPGIPIIVLCVESQIFSILFYNVIIGEILAFLLYIFCIIWEISDAKSKGEGFPYNKIVSPIIALVIFGMIVFGVYKVKESI